MAKTAVINPRRRRRSSKKRRRRNPSASMRAYGSARRRRTNKRRSTRKRRRNPSIQQAYSSGGYRQKNPDLFDLDHIMAIMPAATGGIWGVRWALKMAGPFESEQVTTATGTSAQIAVPGIKHAIAGVLAARIGSGLVAQVLGDSSKAQYAEIAALGFLGDLYMRTRVLAGNQWVSDNLMLQGVDEDACSVEEYDEEEEGMGDPQYMVGPDGQLYTVGALAPDVAALNGMQDSSALGAMQDSSALGRTRNVGSFGY